MKVLQSNWFQELSEVTRFQFFQMLVVNLLADQPSQQKSILEHDKVRALSKANQVKLWRQVASAHLKSQPDLNFAVDCLKEALRLAPNDYKSRVLLGLIQFSNPLARRVFLLWQSKVRLFAYLHTIGKRRAKPVPAQLIQKSSN
jgi:hypothetical protein